ncbi:MULTISPECIES: Cna B-type domain-containing protein, partial [unclassified Streptococcus]
MKNIKKWISLLATLLFCWIGWGFSVTHADTVVATEAELLAALSGGETEVKLSADLTITNPIVISNKQVRFGSADGTSKILTNGSGLQTLFSISNAASVSASNLIFDGDNQGRIFMVENGAKLTLTDVTIKNGTTQPFAPQMENGIDKQRYQGGAIYVANASVTAINTHFINNTTKSDTPVDAQAGSPHGGAVYITDHSNLLVRGGSFKHNLSGKKSSDLGAHGEGGAIKSESSTVVIEPTPEGTRTQFLNNNTYITSPEGGLQGGSIEATDSTLTITNADFIFDGAETTYPYRGGFSTGGFIKLEHSTGSIDNTTFKFHQLADGFGISGGAIASQNSDLEIRTSNFDASTGGAAKVIEAGGFITVYGSGSFKLFDSTMTGTGSSWQGPRLASYGGAIAFYNDARIPDAIIDNTTIRNVAADHLGGAIAISTPSMEGIRNGNYHAKDTARVQLTVNHSTVDNTRSYWWNTQGRGGAIYVGPSADESEKNTLLVTGTRLINGFANYGGAIYNDGGAVTVTDESTITADSLSAFNLGGYIYNNGYLKLDKVDMSRQTAVGPAAWHGNPHTTKSEELPGTGVYANKDVIVTPEAKLGTNDIRVLDKQSAVRLTGSLTRQLNISVSEKEKLDANDENSEAQHRYIGYTVATGIDNYIPTVEDAQRIHYQTKYNESDKTGIYSQAVSDYSDHVLPAKWDYVLNPDTKSIVLGQRGVLIYHTNHKDATITSGQPDSDNAGQQITQLYTFYESSPSIKSTPVELTAVEEKPTLANYQFKNWYQPSAKGFPIYEDNPSSIYHDFKEVTFTNRAGVTGEVTGILNPDIRNTLHVFAAYVGTIEVAGTKTWADNDNQDGKRPEKLVVKLLKTVGGQTTEAARTETSAKEDWKYSFTNLPQFENGQAITYSIDEELPAGYTKVVDGYNLTNIYSPEVTEVTGSKTWDDADNQDGKRPDSITVHLLANGQKVASQTVTATDNWTYRFTNLARYQAGKAIAYTIAEEAVPNYQTSLDGYNLTNHYSPEMVDITVHKKWEDGNNQDGKRPDKILVHLLANGERVDSQTIQADATGNWMTSFTNKPKYAKGQVIRYTVEEVAVDDYTTTVHDFTIINSYTPKEISYQVTKKWADRGDQDGKRPSSITVQLYKSVAGSEPVAIAGKTLTLTKADQTDDETWTGRFTQLPQFENGQEIQYSVREDEATLALLETAGYRATVEGQVITNSRTPEMIRITGSKVWEDANNQDGKRPSSIVLLVKDGQGQE